MILNRIIKNAKLLVLRLLVVMIISLPVCAVAQPVFMVTPLSSRVFIQPNGDFGPVQFEVENVSGKTMPHIDIEANYISSSLFNAVLINSPGDCQSGQSLTSGDACNITMNIHAGENPGNAIIRPRVCAFGGFLCSSGMEPIHIIANPAVKISGTIVQDLPANMPEGKQEMFSVNYTNNGRETATGISIIKPAAPGLVVTNNCNSSTLAPGASCAVSVEYTPPVGTSGTKNFNVTLKYDQGNAVTKTVTTNVTDIAISGAVTADLPTNTPEGTRELFTVTYTNNTAGTATGITMTLPTPTSGLNMINNCTSGTLGPGASCTVTGEYTPPIGTKGGQTFNVTLDYDQGAAVAIPVTTNVTDIAISGAITANLPTNTPPVTSELFTVTYTNGTAGTATGIVINEPSAAGLSVTNNCGSRLAPGASCTVTGEYTPPGGTSNTQTFNVTLDYDQGTSVTIPVTTNVTNIAVSGAVTADLPTNTPEGTLESFTVTYTNGSASPATGILITEPSAAGLSVTNNCNSGTLAAGATCTVTGEYTPPVGNTGAQTFDVTLNYNEGNPVTIPVATTVDDIAVSGAVTADLPTNTPTGITKEFTVTYTNNSPGTATGIVIDPPSAAGLSITNNCSSLTLGSGASCTVTGDYTPPAGTTGEQTFNVTLEYDQGTPVTIPVTTNVTDIAVSGAVTADLPTNTHEETPESFTVTYTNGSASPATGIVITEPSAAGLSVTNNCNSGTLAAGATCTVTGEYTPPVGTTGAQTFDVTLNYNEGNPVTIPVATTVDDIAVSGTVTADLPTNTAVGTPALFRITYTNNSPGTATGISVTQPVAPGLTILDGCGERLLPSGSCIVTGTYVPTGSDTGVQTFDVTLNYAQGTAVRNTVTTNVTDIAVSGAVTRDLPPNIPAGTLEEFEVTYTNGHAGNATGISMTLPAAPGLSVTNNCGSTLTPNDTCTVVGEYRPPIGTAGTQTFDVTLNYNEGNPVTNTVTTTV